MKNQFRKGFRQKYKGVEYDVRVVKLCAGEKLVIRDEIYTKPVKK